MMAKNRSPEEMAAQAEKKRLAAEKKDLKRQQRIQKKETKRRAREIARQEEELAEEEDGNGFVTFLATIVIVALWLAVICIIIKLDIGGFGTNVMTPLIQDVPVINRILPGNDLTETVNPENYGGYSSLQDAVEQIKNLELQLESAQTNSNVLKEEIESLKAEVIRLQEFENMQVEFQRIRTQFYEEVVYAENGPGAEEFQKYYESMDPTTAEYIYKQVITQREEDKEIEDYALGYSSMKPKQAAAIFDTMEKDLELVARILKTMSAEDRANILGNMNADIAAKLTKIMDPER